MLTSLLASAIGNGIYSATVRTAIVTVFITMASLNVIPLLLTYYVNIDHRRQPSDMLYAEIDDDKNNIQNVGSSSINA